MEILSLNSGNWQLKEFVGLDWVWRDSEKPDTKDTRWWIPATVPGSVLQDLFAAGKVPNPYVELNSKQCEWASARTWVYRTTFFVPPNRPIQRATLCFEGIDYAAAIYLNGTLLCNHSSMYTPCCADVTAQLIPGENLLAVVIEPAPFEQPQVGKTSLTHTHKSRMTYWWDFCPRLPHQGIWDDVYIRFTGSATLQGTHVYADLHNNCTEAIVNISAEVDGPATHAEIQFGEFTQQVKVCSNRVSCQFTLTNPVLWQPNGLGTPYEYPVCIRLMQEGVLSDENTLLFGIRSFTWKHNPGRETKHPYLLCVNDKPVFINGINWVPYDVLYGVENAQKQRHLVQLAKNAGINMFRVWGGGLIEKSYFYRLCAENGIMVWQEFILSSSGIDNKTPQNPEFIDFMQQEAHGIVQKRRNETALCVWGGGNELQTDDGLPLPEDDPLLQALGRTVAQLDATRTFLPTSPYGGMFLNTLQNITEAPTQQVDVHGPWEHQGFAGHCKLYNAGTSQLHSEFGVEGMTNQYALDQTISEQNQWPAGKDNEIYFHRGAWWTNDALVQEMFAGISSAPKMRLASQYLQYEGMKYAIERNRSRMPECSGNFPWQFNEPYPNAFCTSHIDYFGQPKPVYYGVKKAYAPFCVAARFASPCLAGAENLTADIQLFSTAPAAALRVTASLHTLTGEALYEETYSLSAVGANTTHVGQFTHAIGVGSPLLFLRLAVHGAEDELLCRNEYMFTTEDSYSALFAQAPAGLSVAVRQGALVLTNTGTASILWLHMYQKPASGQAHAYFEDGYFTLFPYEQRIINVYGLECVDTGSLFAEAFNLPERKIYTGV